jgi:hypothetical protein
MSISKVVDKAEVDPSVIPVNFSESPCNASKVSLPDFGTCKDSFYIDELLSEEETQHLIDCVENAGLEFWNPNSDETDVFRRAYTLEVKHQKLADLLWSRVKDLVIPSVSIVEDDERHEMDNEGKWDACGMNPNMLFSRYLNGGHFAPHTDGTTVVDLNQRSLFTCVIYLNNCEEGGHTRIYSNEQISLPMVIDSEGRQTGQKDMILHEVGPVRGRMLVFYHTQMHEGVPASCKYIIRTDVMYQRNPAICTEPEDKVAFELYMRAQRLAEDGKNGEALALFKQAFKMSRNLNDLYKQG